MACIFITFCAGIFYTACCETESKTKLVVHERIQEFLSGGGGGGVQVSLTKKKEFPLPFPKRVKEKRNKTFLTLHSEKTLIAQCSF